MNKNSNYYFDNAATTATKPKVVSDSIYQVLNSGLYGNAARGSHLWSINSYRLIFETRELIAKFFNAPNADNVIFTSNITMALNMVITGLLKNGDHVITTSYEHNSVIRPLSNLAKQNISYDIIPTINDLTAELDYRVLPSLLKNNTKMLICNHASNVIGNLVNLQILSDFCKKNNLLFVVDAAQTAGVFPIDMEKNNISVLCFTGHKSLYGPQGIGGCCLADNILPEPLLLGGTGQESFQKMPKKELPGYLEAGTLNIIGIAGLSAGIKYIQETTLNNIQQQQDYLVKKFYNALKNIDKLIFYGDYNTIRAPIVAFNLINYQASEISTILSEEFNIAVRAGAHCAPWIHQALHTDTQGIIRFSFSSMNTEQEIDYAINAIKQIVKISY